MKKFIALLLGIMLTFSLVACTGTTPDPTPEATATVSGGANSTVSNTEKPENTSSTEDGTAPEKGKTLVVYFSGSGNTKRVAENIADATGGTLFELVPATPYTSEDLNWTLSGSRVNREHDDESLRDVPLVATTPENFSDYDTVFLGYPIWWGIAAWPVNNFVKNNDFSGKTVIPFATSSSSGMGQSGKLLADMAGTGNWKDGQRFSSGASESSVKDWVNSLG